MAIGREAPAVFIGGMRVPESWAPPAIAGVDSLRLVWGRADQYDPNEPTTLDLTVIDPSGQWAASTALTGAAVIVQLASGRILFRGRVAGVRMSRADVDGLRVWLAQVAATDTLGDLARDVAYQRTPITQTTKVPTDPGGWQTNNSKTFLATLLLEGGANQYVTSIEAVTNADGAPATRVIEISEKQTWLDLINGVYRIVPFAVANYDPDANAIILGRPAPAQAEIELRWVPPEIEMLTGGPTTVTIPARFMEYTDDPPELVSTVADAMTGVQLNIANTWQQPSGDGLDKPGALAKAIPGTGDRGGARVLQVDTIALGGFKSLTDSTVSYPDPGLGIWAILDNWVAAVAVMNDKMRIPPLRYILDQHPADLDSFFLRTYSRPLTVAFIGSELRTIPNVPAAYQVIGGVLDWASGWVVTVNAAAAPGAQGPQVVTIAELVTNITPAFRDYSPEITLADLGAVTNGAD